MASSFPRKPAAPRDSPEAKSATGAADRAANQDRFRHMIESASSMMWSADERMHITYSNRRLLEYSGLPPEGDMGDWARRLVHPEDLANGGSSFREALDAGREAAMEARLRRRDGCYRWFMLCVVPLKDESGRVVEWTGSAVDIDERKRSEENLRFLAEASVALSQLADLDETLKRLAALAVPRFCDYVEVSLKEPHGAVRRLAVHHGDPQRVAQVEEIARRFPPLDNEGVRKVIATGETVWLPEVGDEMLRAAARSDEHLEMIRALKLRSYACVPMRSKSRILGALAFATSESGRTFLPQDLDVATELAHRAAVAIENAELVGALRDADRRKDEFLAVLAHELRNPLAPVRNAIEILRATQSPSPQLQWTHDVIDRQVRQMTRLVDDLLDVSRITTGKIELRNERIELSAAVRIALEASRPLIERGQHILTVRIPPEPIYLNADLARLAQILSNLLNNAAKYTRPGGHIWLTAERCDGHVKLRVRDNGMGIPPPMLRKIFDMFTQVGGTSDHQQGGLGIGLTLVKRLVEMHGGQVEARSDGINRGSEFIVTLPTITGEEAAPGPTPAVPESAVEPRRILVVDDNRDAAESLSMLLHARGHDVRVAYDGLEAVGAAIAFQPDVVLLDIGLPKLYGYDAARRIRDARGDGVLLIAVTGWGQEEDRRRAKAAGFDHHLTKPVDPEAISRLIDGHGK
ncbi:MAG TPA: ATP-binding protein [Usitatibacter sp.]|jgi:PAS domain S-box-containing protein|nr:ATP-binding protein [Usitatibacter sp.]